MSRLMTAAALALLSACVAPARTDPPAPAQIAQPAPAAVATALVAPEPRRQAGVACEIRATRTSNGVRLEAVARSSRAVRGDYDFVITSQSAGGSSDVAQGGPFATADASDLIVGTAEIGRERPRYRAVLTLRDADGELCRSERRS